MLARIRRSYCTSFPPSRQTPHLPYHPVTPPVHFHNAQALPRSFDSNNSAKPGSPAMDFVSLLGMCVLAYLALDNYNARVTLEKKAADASARWTKAARSLHAKLMAERQKRDQHLVRTRRDQIQRDMRMAIHIAMLREQLISSGKDPVTVARALQAYHENVSLTTGPEKLPNIWINDDSTLKPYLPDPHEYDSDRRD